MGFVITGCANLMILGEIPSYPVAFLMFNLFICLVTKSSFIGLNPEKLKAAQVSPLFKKNNSLDKSNYRPISVLPMISKFYERAIFDQLMEFLNNHYYQF
jgi:hypothetical protein